jgi:hypothetical protein
MQFAWQIPLLLLLVSIPAVAGLVVRRRPPQERSHLILLLLVALGLRLLLAVAWQEAGWWQLTLRGAATPDEGSVDRAARILIAAGGGSPADVGGSLHTSWLLVSWAVYDLLWNNLLAVRIVNVVLGTVLVLVTWLLADSLTGARTARLVGWAAALWPPAIVWSAMALRDGAIGLLMTFVALGIVRLLEPDLERVPRLAWVGGVATTIVVVAFTRAYVVPMIIATAFAAALMAARRSWTPTLLVVGASVLSLATILVLPAGPDTMRLVATLLEGEGGGLYNPLNDCRSDCEVAGDPELADALQEDLIVRPSIRGPTGSRETTVPAGEEVAPSLSFRDRGLIEALAIATLAGRPVWLTEEFFFLLQPGVVAWWGLLPLMGAGGVVLSRRSPAEGTVLVLFVAGVTVFLALSGQFLRHHFMVEPMALVLAGTGWSWARTAGRVGGAVLVASGLMLAAALTSVIVSLPVLSG